MKRYEFGHIGAYVAHKKAERLPARFYVVALLAAVIFGLVVRFAVTAAYPDKPTYEPADIEREGVQRKPIVGDPA